jgi:hypothetical protein
MMNLTMLQELQRRLIRLAERFEEEVLRPLGFIIDWHRAFASTHPYWTLRETIAQRYSNRIADLIRDPRDAWDGLDKKTHICILIQDWTNEYSRECLTGYHLISESYTTIGLDHPFYQARWDFIEDHFDEIESLRNSLELADVGKSAESQTPSEEASSFDKQLVDRMVALGWHVETRAGAIDLIDMDSTDFGPEGLGLLASINAVRELDASRTGFDDRATLTLLGLTGLKRLTLNETSVTDKGLLNIGNIRSLEVLEFEGNPITDEGLRTITALSRLRALSLAKSKITDFGVASIRSFSQLESLDLSGTAVADAGINSLAALVNLSALYLADCGITDSALEVIGQMRKLRELDLAETSITDQGLSSLTSLSQVEWLCLTNTAISEESMSALKRLSSLRDLHLGGTRIAAERWKLLSRPGLNIYH